MNIIKTIKYKKDRKIYFTKFAIYFKIIQIKMMENDKEKVRKYEEKLAIMVHDFYQKYPTKKEQ